MSLAFADGGVVEYRDNDLGRPVVVRVAEAQDGRLEVVEVYLGADGTPIPSDLLRRIPLARIEALVNETQKREVVRHTLEAEPANIADAARHLNEEAAEMAEAAQARRRARPLRIKLPTGPKYPDSF